MANTPDLVRIHAHCQQAGAKLLLTGDHHQLAAVGAAGGMDLVAATGARHELAETHRFAHAWEGAASLRLRERDHTVLADYHKHSRLLDGGALDQAETAAARAWLADTLSGQQALLIVDTNEQVARLSAQLRADLVRLGRVDDQQSVPLGLEGTWAGVGDIVQARRNGWHLAGYHGNRRGPINRERYRVTAVRDDGGLEVTTLPGGTDLVEGDRIVLPVGYVAEHLALGYATTVHAAQGLTVDTCHTVVTQTTAAEAVYVGMTRGRQANTAHVVTRAVPSDASPGTVLAAVHRSPAVVLAGVFETSDPHRSALAQAVDSATEAESVRTPAELFADAAQLAHRRPHGELARPACRGRSPHP
jgi:ATP-dependent exoDNAse (exonuclease V) alpha subunit